MRDRETTRRLLEDQILRLWGEGRTELVAANYSSDIVDHMPVRGQPAGLTGMAQVVGDFRAGLPDMTMTLHGTIVNGTLGCDFWTMAATNDGSLFGRPPTGHRVEISGIDMVKVRDGRIAELWHVEEMLQMGAQLGDERGSFGAPTEDYASVPAGPYDPGANAWSPDPTTLTERERRTLAVAREHIEEIWAKGNEEAARRLYAPEVIDRNPAPG